MRLMYFAVPGRAEASRLALALSGMEWEDVEIDGNTFQKMRQDGLLPWDMLPVLETDQGMLAESSAILRFAGEKAGLLPEDAFMRAKVNEFLDGMGPIARAMDTTFGIEDAEERIRLRKSLFEPRGAATKAMKTYEAKLAQSPHGWAAGTEEMSIADLKLFTELFAFFSGNYDGIEPSMLEGYEILLSYHHQMATEPRIRHHYRNITRDDIRWTFLPNAFDS